LRQEIRLKRTAAKTALQKFHCQVPKESLAQYFVALQTHLFTSYMSFLGFCFVQSNMAQVLNNASKLLA